MTWIKICGITNKEDAAGACRLGADALGFILSTDSPRRIDPLKAQEIIKAVRNKSFDVDMVGVFVNESAEKVADDFKSLGLDYAQLSGDEDEEYIRKMKSISSNIKIIKAIRIKDGRDYRPGELNSIVKNFAGFIDLVLMDSYKKDIYGGTGQAFDWATAKSYKQEVPLILSGGLDCSNIKDAVKAIDPFGVDASSRLEASPGKKDLGKVADLINALR